MLNCTPFHPLNPPPREGVWCGVLYGTALQISIYRAIIDGECRDTRPWVSADTAGAVSLQSVFQTAIRVFSKSYPQPLL